MLFGRKEPHLIRLNHVQEDAVHPVVTLNVPVHTWRIFITNLTLNGYIGIYPAEKIEPQKIIINLACVYCSCVPEKNASLDKVVCYKQLAHGIEALISKGHIPFVENLADEIIDMCFTDERITDVTVRVEKPDALSNAAAVGVELTRSR